MRLFISWSGVKSKAVAQALRQWIPRIIKTVDPWLSEVDINAGARWNKNTTDALEETEFSIVCLTKHNQNAPWIHFEAGYIARSPKASICPYLIDLTSEDLTRSPLEPFQAKPANETGTWEMIRAINKAQTEDQIAEGVLKEEFDYLWRLLDDKLKNLPEELPSTEEPPTPEITPKEMSDFQDRFSKSLKAKISATFRLHVFNPSFYSRKGHITTLWQPIYEQTHIPPEELIIRDGEGNILPSQVDDFDRYDSAQATLAFSLSQEIPPGPEDYSTPSSFVTIERGQPGHREAIEPRVKIDGLTNFEQQVKLHNDRLEVLIELTPKPWEDKGDWYAGSVSSVRLHGREILDAFYAQLDYVDFERRCMQLDQLELLHQNGDSDYHERPNLINQRYQLISKSSGPVRASITIASQPFDYYNFPAQGNQASKCRLYRMMSLYREETYITEKLMVVGIRTGAVGTEATTHHHFKTRYFSYFDMGFDPEVFDKIRPEWFSIGCKWAPFPGYGFGADVHSTPVANPHPEFPQNGNEHKSFSWKLGQSLNPQCLHLFMQSTPKQVESKTRRAWHEVIDKPLKARIAT